MGDRISRLETLDLRHSAFGEEPFRLLVDSVRDYAIFLMDTEGHIQSWNAGAERIKGYSAHEIIGQHFSIFYTHEDISRSHPLYELSQASTYGRYEEEGWRIRKNKTHFWANVVITPLRNKQGDLVGFAKVTRDLTERKEAEERLKKSEAMARRMFEGVKDYAIISLHPDGTVASWNEGARRIKGYEPDEVIGKYFSIFYPEQDVKMGKCEYELNQVRETGRYEEEGWRLRKDGTKFWASVLITVIRSDEGQVLGFSKVTRDMTERKRVDDLLRMSYASLEKRVEERTADLTKINDQLQEAIKVRDEFLSIASHELRTPLTPLKLQIQSLMGILRKSEIAGLSSERLERMALNCDKSIVRLANLVENLLDVSRISTGRLNLSCEKINLTEFLAELIDRYRLHIGSEEKISFESESDVVGFFDRLRLEQVITNIISNAIKYGERKPIEVKAWAESGNVYISVRDHGVGISTEDQARIFERFERVKGSSNIGGLGLGLHISRQIVESHHGKIFVESQVGLGSCFTVFLPRCVT